MINTITIKNGVTTLNTRIILSNCKQSVKLTNPINIRSLTQNGILKLSFIVLTPPTLITSARPSRKAVNTKSKINDIQSAS